MVKEVLYINEEDLEDTINIIRSGLAETYVSGGLQENTRSWNVLFRWCNEMDNYVKKIRVEE